jgi:hypothetical protein
MYQTQMRHSFFAFLVFFAATAGAQDFDFRIRGDTSGAPRGCSARESIRVLNDWFNAFNTADSAKLDQLTAPRFVFSTGRFAPSEAFFVTRDIGALMRYVRSRAVQHEQMRVQEVKFNRWRSRALQFGPIYFLRSARDLGSKPVPGIGKGGVLCGGRLGVLNVGPRPSFDPGPKQ